MIRLIATLLFELLIAAVEWIAVIWLFSHLLKKR